MMQMLSAPPVVNLYHHEPPVARFGRDHAGLHSTFDPQRAPNSSSMQQPAVNGHRAVSVDYYKNYRNSPSTQAASTSNGAATMQAVETADKAHGQQPHGQLIHHQAPPTRSNSGIEHLAPSAAAAAAIDSLSVGPSARRISAQHQVRQESRRRSTSANFRANNSVLRPAKSETNLRPNTVQRSRSAMLSDQELFQIQLMYSGRATKVIVCSCLANLYVADARIKSGGDAKAPARASDWELIATGVPVLLLDCGETRTRSFRRILLILAEKGTGFALWKDQIDSLTKYTEIGKSFHTMLLSTNHQRMAGFSFDSAYSSMQFFQHVTEMCSNPENVALCPPSREEKKSRRHSFNGGVKKSLLRKSEISYPCCFNHVTSLKPHYLADDCAPKRAQSCIQIDEHNQKLPSPTRSY